MTIKVVGTANPTEYITTCTDNKCRAILEFTEDDIGFNRTYSMGRECGNHEGIVCPKCNQVLHKKDFKLNPAGRTV